MKKNLIITALLILLLGAAMCGCSGPQEPAVTSSEPQADGNLTLVLPGPELPSREELLQYSDLQVLDVRSIKLTITQYEQLKQDFPDCEILWLVPFQGDYLAPDIRELTITELSFSDSEHLRYFPNLESIYADGCRDYAQLLALEDAFPNLSIYYTFSLAGTTYSNYAATQVSYLELPNADVSELTEMLPYFTNVSKAVFTGTVPANEDLYQLMLCYPHISFQWELTLFGITISNTVTSLILSGIPMTDTVELEGYLKYFPNLERVEVCDCGLSSDQMDALSQRYPDIRFIWTITIGKGTLRTDAQAFIPYKLGYDIDRPLGDAELTELKYCTDLICLDLGHMKVHDISFLEYMPNMQYLVLVDMPCKDFSVLANLKELIYLELFNVQFTEHDALLELTKLEDLNISSTPTRDTEILKQMTWLKRLWLVRTKLNGSQIDELKQSLPNTEIVIYALHSTDKGWRDNQNYRDMRDLLGMFYMN